MAVTLRQQAGELIARSTATTAEFPRQHEMRYAGLRPSLLPRAVRLRLLDPR